MNQVTRFMIVTSASFFVIVFGNSCRRTPRSADSEHGTVQNAALIKPGKFGAIEVHASDCQLNKAGLQLFLFRAPLNSCPERHSEELFVFADSGILIARAVSDSSGIAVFDSLTPWLYSITNGGQGRNDAPDCTDRKCVCIRVRPDSVSEVFITMGGGRIRIPEENMFLPIWRPSYHVIKQEE